MTCTRLWLVATIGVLGMQPVPQSRAGGFSIDECAVWTRELSFAATVARHDAEAFAGHLEPDAVFGAGSQARTRGREAIVERWRRIIEGKQVTIEWYPTRTTVGGVDGIGLCGRQVGGGCGGEGIQGVGEGQVDVRSEAHRGLEVYQREGGVVLRLKKSLAGVGLLGPFAEEIDGRQAAGLDALIRNADLFVLG